MPDGRLAGAVKWTLSPRYRRWRTLLASCSFRPEDALPLAPVGHRDVIICGLPRSGTALLAAQLFQPPRIVTVMEPWDGLRMPPHDLFVSLREEIASGVLARGRLDVAALRDTGRVVWTRDGQKPVPVSAAEDAVLAVKWPGFWRYLPLLPNARFVVTVRHPVEVIASFDRVGGRLGDGLEYDVPLHADMNRELGVIRDPVARQTALFDHIARRILPHLDRPDVFVVRYERWFQDPSDLLAELATFLEVDALEPAPAVITQPPTPPRRDQWREIAERCRSAEALGYDLDRQPS